MKIFIVCITLAVLFTGAYSVFATSKDDIVYPIGALGNCIAERECRAYCEEFSHIAECLVFAQEHNLLSAHELAEARKFAQLGISAGPGGCRGEEKCQTYCENISNIQECLVFAERHKIMSDEELDEARKVERALREGAQLPGGCQSKERCEAYCEDSDHMAECLAFAEQAGFLPEHELQEAKKVLRALEAGSQLPGGCRGKEQCKTYCSEPSHAEECFEFAVAAGFMNQDEIAEARKIMPFMMRGEMPGACRSRQECEAYCFEGSHTEECVTFFEKAGVMSAEDSELFRKTGGRGPGECRGKEGCDSFCNDPANQQICFDFAKQHDLIGEEELVNMEEGIGRFRSGFQNAPPEVARCLKERVGEEVLSKIEAGTFLPNQELGENMRNCFEEFMPESGRMERQGEFHPGSEGGLPAGRQGFVGPPEAVDCIQRILSGHSGPPTPEQEVRMRQECFMPLSVPGFPGGSPEEFQRQFQQEFQQQYQEESQEQFQQRFQEQFQRQHEQQSSGGEGFQAPAEFHLIEPERPEAPLPASQLPKENFLGAVWEVLKPSLRILMPFLD